MTTELYSKEELLGFYSKIILLRSCDESFVEPILDGSIRCPVHLYTGQEAVAV